MARLNKQCSSRLFHICIIKVQCPDIRLNVQMERMHFLLGMDISAG
jgi:hypothetical protein